MLKRLKDWWRTWCCPHATIGSRTWYEDEAVHTETLCFQCGKRLQPVLMVSDDTVMRMLIERAKRV